MFSAKNAWCAGLAAILVGAFPGESPMIAAAVPNAPPPVLWQDVRQLNLLCLAAGPAGVDQSLAAELCERVRARAAEGAPYPVAVIALGDPAVLRPDAVTLLVHASYRPHGDARLLALSVRPYRNAAEPDGLLFAAAPRAVLIPADRAGPALDEPIRLALSETLPWQAPEGATRPLVR